jgi:hypothetical protein
MEDVNLSRASDILSGSNPGLLVFHSFPHSCGRMCTIAAYHAISATTEETRGDKILGSEVLTAVTM